MNSLCSLSPSQWAGWTSVVREVIERSRSRSILPKRGHPEICHSFSSKIFALPCQGRQVATKWFKNAASFPSVTSVFERHELTNFVAHTAFSMPFWRHWCSSIGLWPVEIETETCREWKKFYASSTSTRRVTVAHGLKGKTLAKSIKLGW